MQENTDIAISPDPYDALGALYDEWVVSVVEDLPFYLDLAQAQAAELGRPLEILELGAGSGRVAIPLALRGHTVTALDTAPGQLTRMRAGAREAEVPEEQIIEIVGDMRDLAELVPAGASYDLVIAPFRSLLHIAPEAESVTRQVAALLRPDARFACDVFHPGPESVEEFHDRWLLRRRFTDADNSGTWSIWERARFDLDAEQLQLDIRCDFKPSSLAAPDAAPAHADRTAHMLLHTPSPFTWRDSFEKAGLQIETVYGWFDERPLEPDDQDSIWVARAR